MNKDKIKSTLKWWLLLPVAIILLFLLSFLKDEDER